MRIKLKMQPSSSITTLMNINSKLWVQINLIRLLHTAADTECKFIFAFMFNFTDFVCLYKPDGVCVTCATTHVWRPEDSNVEEIHVL